ncbi:hypothetical protein, partial [Nitrospira sp. BLG_2]|uniref:hypothetical protein n=1 Tax=Nitrospira sp. BLG_2 TaxID=3397507 RepID=UPI003B9A1084
EDERLAMYDKRIRNQELQQDQDRLQSRIDMERNRLFQKQQFQAQQDNIATDNRLQQERFDASRRDQQKQFELQNKRLDVEAQRQRDSEMKNEKRFSSSLRKEFRTLPSVKDYEQVLPVVQSAKKAPDNGYGDLQLIYTVGKALDPNSVVREGELALTVAAGSPIQRLLGTTRFSIEKGGRLTPQLRAQILNMLDQRVGAYQQAYEKDRNQYAQYAGEQGLDPEQIVGKHALSAYDAPSSGPGRSPAGLSTGAMKYLEE